MPSELLTLSAPLTIARAPELQAALVAGFARGEALTVRTSGEAGGHLAIVQLLCAARRYGLGRNKALVLEQEGPGGLREVALRAGFDRHASCPAECAAACLWNGRS